MVKLSPDSTEIWAKDGLAHITVQVRILAWAEAAKKQESKKELDKSESNQIKVFRETVMK